MIWRARFPRRPPAGRIDGIMYYGGHRTMADLLFYAADLDTNQQVVVPQADMPPSPPSGAAGGGLAGTYPNPTVAAVPDSALSANVPLLVAGVYPAGSAENLTNVPPAEVGKPGTCWAGSGAFDNPGTKVLTAGADFPNPIGDGIVCTIVACGASATGIIRVNTANVGPGGSFTVTSENGSDDDTLAFIYIVCYLVEA